MKKLISMCLVIILCFINAVPLYAEEIMTKNDLVTITDGMVDIVLENTDNRSVVVSVPQSQALSYQLKINSDVTFKQKEINKALQYLGNQERALPEGRILHQEEMDMESIEKIVDQKNGFGTFVAFMNSIEWLVGLGELLEIIELSKCTNAIMLASNLLATAATNLNDRQQTWWETAEKDILNGVIRAVRLTIIENNGDYPKVYRIIERL